VLPEFLGAAGVAGLATWAGFQTMWPTSQVYGRTFIGLDPPSRLLALTYDDGPNDPWTLRLLEVLDRHQVKATFFLIGKFVEQRPDIARSLVEAGHTIGSHTWDHPNLIFCSSAEVRRQLEQTQHAIFDATGVKAKLFRPPFGGRRPASLGVARSLGLQPIMWNVSCYDWKAKSADEIVAKAERQIRGGNVILLHDGEFHRIGVDRSRSVEASDRILTRYKQEGYEFVTVPQMISATATSR
jgi:peptidoglycan/xylan/chitin deacetylase (PgdA/CDA1 family)